MSAFQKVSLLFMALIFVAIVALVGVLAFRSPTQTVIIVSATHDFNADNQTSTAVEVYLATNLPTIAALATELALTYPSP